MDLQLHQLRSFVTVAEELHFGRAALRLNLSQPQVSRHVRHLEDTLGVILFVRGARRTTLTGAGVALLQDAREALAAAERLQSRAAAVELAPVGRVGVGFVWSTLGAAHGTVTLLISRRLSTVRGADLIVVLERGHAVESGTHAQLLAAGGIYAELFALQARAYA